MFRIKYLLTLCCFLLSVGSLAQKQFARFSSGGNLIIYWQDDNAAIYSASTGKFQYDLPRFFNCEFSSDDRWLALGGNDSTTIIETATGRVLKKLPIGSSYGFSFSSGNEYLIVSIEYGPITFIDTSTWEIAMSIPHHGAGRTNLRKGVTRFQTYSSSRFTDFGEMLPTEYTWELSTKRFIRASIITSRYDSAMGYQALRDSVPVTGKDLMNLAQMDSEKSCVCNNGRTLITYHGTGLSGWDAKTARQSIRYRGGYQTTSFTYEPITFNCNYFMTPEVIYDMKTGLKLQSIHEVLPGYAPYMSSVDLNPTSNSLLFIELLEARLPPWDPATDYFEGDIISYSGKVFAARKDNRGADPTVDTQAWTATSAYNLPAPQIIPFPALTPSVSLTKE